MPVVLGWTAVRGKLEIETLIFLPSCLSGSFHIPLHRMLYREDYAQVISACCRWSILTEIHCVRILAIPQS